MRAKVKKKYQDFEEQEAAMKETRIAEFRNKIEVCLYLWRVWFVPEKFGLQDQGIEVVRKTIVPAYTFTRYLELPKGMILDSLFVAFPPDCSNNRGCNCDTKVEPH